MFKRISTALIFIFATLLLSSCVRPSGSQIEFALGTVCAVNLYEKGNDPLYSRIFSRVREIDRTMSFYAGEYQDMLGGALTDPDGRTASVIQSAAEALTSGVFAVNVQAGITPVKVRADLIEVLEKALYYAELSDGAFDPTVGPLVRLWGIGTDNPYFPDEDEITQALDLVNWRDLIIDRENSTAFLRRRGMAIDLGAIAKGYAVDEAVRIAREAGVKRAIFDFGGDIAVIGWREEKGKNRLPWRIGIQNPLSERGAYIGILRVNDKSIVTSGVYERFSEMNEKRYHHILSTKDGYPVENGLLSVTVMADQTADADAISTAAFALGFEKGKALIDTIPGVEAIFIFDDNIVKTTAGMFDIFVYK